MPSPATLLYSVFHLNLCYSSIEENRRPHVIEHCYWPLLRLVRDHGLPLGLEASAYTLEAIRDIDPSWIETLRGLLAAGACEFVGSGYAQIAGPLVPADVNAANLKLGNQVYQTLLGVRPALALVNEQVFSAGLVEHYLSAGYRAIVMDWDNPARNNPDWTRALGAMPQRALGVGGQSIPVLWSHSLGFQRFQRYAHGDTGLDDFLAYLAKQTGGLNDAGAYPVYTNDAEVFDFRPGRHKTEPMLDGTGEWTRIEQLYGTLQDNPRYRLVAPSEVLDLLDQPGAGTFLRLESAEHPLPLKKQDKYSIIRWAVTGRDDLRINTLCWDIFQALKSCDSTSDEDWRELCYLWSSDFRTHVTDARWLAYSQRLETFHQSVVARPTAETPITTTDTPPILPTPPDVERSGRWLDIETGALALRIDCDRGGAIDRLRVDGPDQPLLLGTLRHGFFDDITLGADWYSGHLVFDPPGRPKVTDLSPVEPEVTVDDASGVVTVSCTIDTDLGAVRKRLRACPRSRSVTLDYDLDWPAVPLGTLRLGFVTVHPDAFDGHTLWVETENGGGPERFKLDGTAVDHGALASAQVSARAGFGATMGRVTIGDGERQFTVVVDRTMGAAVPLLTYRNVENTFFCRLGFSLREIDDTLRPEERQPGFLRFRMTVSA